MENLQKVIKKLGIFLFIITMGCNARMVPPGEGILLVQSEEARKGQKLFMQFCNKCHPAGLAGLGPSIIDKPLPGFLIKFQVRKGLGVMPAFSKKQISKEELNNLVTYIKKI